MDGKSHIKKLTLDKNTVKDLQVPVDKAGNTGNSPQCPPTR